MPPTRHKRTEANGTVGPPIMRVNQHLPCPPDNELKLVLKFYYHLGMNDNNIATAVMDHFDPSIYSISAYTVRRRRKVWGLSSTRKQHHSVETIAAHVDAIKERFPNRGAETIRKALLMEKNIRVPRPVVAEYLKMIEPDAVQARRFQRFKRRTFLSIGPNEMWSLDQHDKFKRYGLFFHVGLDPYPGVIHWCKVWWTVRNPKLIARFYFDAARAIGGVPLITQSDPGTENVNVAYAHTALRHQADPSLDGTIQHRWFRKHGNIKPEIHWSVFRRDWAAGFQEMLDKGVDQGLYDIGDPLECLIFRFVFIPFIQKEVDAWVHQRNWTKRRADRKKVLPNGIPMLILQKPHRWNAADYKISISPQSFAQMESKYAPSDDPVFKLVPDAFAVHANTIWTAMDSPQPDFHNAWAIYVQIRATLKSVQHSIGSSLSDHDSAQPQDDHNSDVGTSLLIDWEDFSSDGGSSPVLSPIADLTEDEDNAEGHGIGLA
ncbi:hypothetical protein EDB84DRAFT_1545636 [Lactarius hengduanensis]|nr:hypothetical protein EDB84DRAFT_1545636 [Lactarius hengduanensis]